MLHGRSLDPKSHLSEVYIAQVLYGLGVSLIGVFIPIYMMQLGYTLEQALLYIIIHHAANILASPFSAWLNHKVGFKHTTIIRIPIFFASFLTLYSLSYSDIHFFIPAILSGIGGVLYWVPIQTLFLRYSKNSGRSVQVSNMWGLIACTRIVGPAVGGILAVKFGFPILVLVALGIVSISVIPLFSSTEIKSQTEFRWKDLWALRNHKFIGATMGDGASHVVMAYLFPLLIYTTIGKIDTLGYIETIGMLIFTLTTFAMGRLLVRKNHVRWLQTGAILLALTFLVRPFLSTVEGFIAIIILTGLIDPMWHTSYHTLMYSYAHKLKDKGDEFIVVREMFLQIGRISVLALAIMLPWKLGFYIGAAMLAMSAYAMSGKSNFWGD